MRVPQTANQRWSLDFVSDALTDGRRFRIFAVVDDHTRECLSLVADTSLSGLRVTRELDRIIENRGQLQTIVSDNGTEFTSIAVLEWVRETGIGWHYIAPGKPHQTAYQPKGLWSQVDESSVAGQDQTKYLNGTYIAHFLTLD